MPTGRIQVYLNSALDVTPRPSLRISAGAWILQYQFFAIDFPVLEVEVLVTIDPGGELAAELISQRVSDPYSD